MMTWCACVCMCVSGLWRRVLSRKQCIPCPFDFLSVSPSLTHTNSLCFSLKGNSQEMVMVVIKCVNTEKHVHAFSLYISPLYLLLLTKINMWIMEDKWREREREHIWERRDVEEMRERNEDCQFSKIITGMLLYLGTTCGRCSINEIRQWLVVQIPSPFSKLNLALYRLWGVKMIKSRTFKFGREILK